MYVYAYMCIYIYIYKHTHADIYIYTSYMHIPDSAQHAARATVSYTFFQQLSQIQARNRNNRVGSPTWAMPEATLPEEDTQFRAPEFHP